MKFLICFLLASFLFLTCSLSCKDDATAYLPQENNARLSELLDSLRTEFDLPALGAAIITSDSILNVQAVGCRKYHGEKNITNTDKFHIGSNTKAITSALMGILVDEGLVNWSSTLKDIFPEHASLMKEEYTGVTVRELLSHCSGLMRDGGFYPQTGTAKEKRLEVLKWAVQEQPAKQRGEFLYSNLGYIIAGAVIEKITGEQYEELLIERLLTPLGITTAGFGAMGTPGMEDQPQQHIKNSPGNVTVISAGPGSDNPEIYSPAGRLHLSVGDWAKYIRLILLAEKGNQHLISAETAAELTTKVVKSDGDGYYGYGWVTFEKEWAGGRTLFHNGSNGINYSEAWLAPNKDFAIIVVTNQAGGDTQSLIKSVVERLISFYQENYKSN